MPSLEGIMDNVRHEERCRRKVVDSTFESPVGRTKHERADAKLIHCQWKGKGLGMEASHLVRLHRKRLELLVCASYFLAVVPMQLPHRINLIYEMSMQRDCKRIDKVFDFLSIIIFRNTSLGIRIKSFKTWRESPMLFHIALHESLNSSDPFDIREEVLFFRFVVMDHGFAPALAVGEEVLDGGGR